jgi:hypothetical protein
MGQQQLLLLVLGAVIVGIAIVVGINMFGQGAIKAQEDAIKGDLLTMGSRIEEFWRKPIALGGAGKNLQLLTSFPQIGYNYDEDGTQVTAGPYTNSNGQYTVGTATAAAASITAVPVLVTEATDGTKTYVAQTAPVFTLNVTVLDVGTVNARLNFAITP